MGPDQIFLPDPDGADAPIAGFYEDVRRNKVALPVKIWFGPPVDPEDGSIELERGPRWQMMIGNRLVDAGDEEFDQVWPQCLKAPISEGEYRYRMERISYAKTDGAKADPWAHRYGKLDLLTAPIPE